VTRRSTAIAVLLAATAVLAMPVEALAAKKVKFGARTLKSGMAGKDVRILQRSLGALGVSAPTDGVFAPPTRAAVKKLEAQQRWRVDGVVTRRDAKKIIKLVARRKASKPLNLYYLHQGSYPLVTVQAQQAGSATLNVLDTNSGLGIQSLTLTFTAAGQQSAGWNELASTGAFAPDSSYQFTIDPGTAGASIVGGQTAPFLLRAHAFPVPGRHRFGGAGSRFGASRKGHTHQGQDVSARCGEKLVAAQGGTVSVNAYQARGAGHYVVIRGVISGTDYVYMHLKKPSWTSPGTVVYTGQGIGKVGNTGASSGCHLHFERWTAPGWYQGGYPYDPLAELTHWDGYS
jgi:peptidoglycan hydrolase-like protein with peptidoglycan-binding domain